MAERQQVQEADRGKRRGPLPVLQHLALDRDDVGEDVAVGDDDALRLGGRAGREDDLRDIVASDDNVSGGSGLSLRRSVVPLQLVQLPDRRVPRVNGGTSWPISDQPRRHDAADAREKVRRRPVVDRDDDDAAEEAAPERDDPLRPVLAEEDDLVAFPKPERPQARGKCARAAADLLVGVRSAAKPVVVDEKRRRARGRDRGKNR